MIDSSQAKWIRNKRFCNKSVYFFCVHFVVFIKRHLQISTAVGMWIHNPFLACVFIIQTFHSSFATYLVFAFKSNYVFPNFHFVISCNYS